MTDRKSDLEQEVQASLAPCPFCGGQPTYRLSRWSGECSTISCSSCALTMRETKRGTWTDLPDRWNRRA